MSSYEDSFVAIENVPVGVFIDATPLLDEYPEYYGHHEWRDLMSETDDSLVTFEGIVAVNDDTVTFDSSIGKLHAPRAYRIYAQQED